MIGTPLPFTQGYIMASLAEIGSVVLGKKSELCIVYIQMDARQQTVFFTPIYSYIHFFIIKTFFGISHNTSNYATQPICYEINIIQDSKNIRSNAENI